MDVELVKVIDLIPGVVRELPRIAAADLTPGRFMAEYVHRRRPVVITGAARTWPAVSLWSDIEYLAERAGDHEALVGTGLNFNQWKHFFDNGYGHYQRVRLADALRQAHAAPPEEAVMSGSFLLPPKWENDIGRHRFLSEADDKAPLASARHRMFGYRNAGTDWHWHIADESLTTQLRGTKRFSLFELDETNRKFYSYLIAHNLHHVGKAATLLRDKPPVTKYETVLRPGETVYIPPVYWHGVDPADHEIGLTFVHCFRTPLRPLLRSARAIVREWAAAL
ncbi:cupin-like domain-containing protein [Nocardia stercoris]|uniref:JmjC domain-containing protein n=1 Tax=Nocardia stercoris TaxID=2483361 RepID=A0A3M2KYN5_9NOCA|nr:cupin-like domain-containing protein [Nocardia stercoris]RMI30401.1 hypothetical protein EBN03_22460 [Nocardia stercoris]